MYDIAKLSKRIVIIFLFVCPPANAQILVRISTQDCPSDLFHWQESIYDEHFGLASNTEQLERHGIDYRILSKDVTNYTFFWISGNQGHPADLVIEHPGYEMIWSKNDVALFRSLYSYWSIPTPPGFSVARILFNLPNVQNTESVYKKPARQLSNETYGAIIDSVSIEQLSRTVRHLSGEEPFQSDSGLVWIKTRYSISSDIHIAQKYISKKLERYGYPGYEQAFSLENKFCDIELNCGNNEFDQIAKDGWALKPRSIFKTEDGGQTWRMVYHDDDIVMLNKIVPVSENVAYVVGEAGLILKTSNGGEVWQRLDSKFVAGIWGAYFINENMGWFCGAGGTIMKTTDGGNNWQWQKSNIYNTLKNIFFTDSLKGWVVGSRGTLLYTANGGENWLQKPMNMQSDFHSTYFLNDSTGYIAGVSGTLLRTEDGGGSWSKLPIDGFANLYDIDFATHLHGIVVGTSGFIAKTSDGGRSWVKLADTPLKDFSHVKYCSTDLLWLSGNNGFMKSEDGGITWHDQSNAMIEQAIYNVIATKAGSYYPNKYYIICAHYDALSEMPHEWTPGADDNASGTSAVIEAARILAKYQTKYSVKFILFAGEEQGLIGSQKYAAEAQAREENIMGVFNLDMIGYDANLDTRFEIHANKNLQSQNLGNTIQYNANFWSRPLEPEYNNYSNNRSSDHGAFWNYDYPAVLIIEDLSDFNRFYHKTSDRISAFSVPYFHEISRLAIITLAQYAEIDGTVDVAGPSYQPASFKLYEPYPNPFTESFDIEYDLYYPGRVDIDIFNVLGRRIQDVHLPQQQAGKHKFRWKASALKSGQISSGVYIIVMRTNHQTARQKVLFIK